jgi:hypothetical protein
MNGGASPYTTGELATLATHCRKQEDAAEKVERQMRKSAAALLLSPRTGDGFDAIVTGGSEKGTWVRMFDPPAEGRVVRGFDGMMSGSASGCDWCRQTSRAASSISSTREFPRVSARISGSLFAHTSTLGARNSIAPGWRNWQTHRT